jgi:hypothetical protein
MGQSRCESISILGDESRHIQQIDVPGRRPVEETKKPAHKTKQAKRSNTGIDRGSRRGGMSGVVVGAKMNADI